METIRIYLMLGLLCNCKCKHCQQIPVKDIKDSNIREINKNLLDFLGEWSSHRKKPILSFWGGEPLVYFKEIVKFVSVIREKAPNIIFSITTNGMLLDEEKIAYLRENNFEIILSHDAPNADAVRDGHVDDYQTSLLQNYPWLKVTHLFCAQNPSIVDARSYLKNKFPNAKITTIFPMITCEANENLIDFKEGEVEKAFIDFFRSIDGQLWYQTSTYRVYRDKPFDKEAWMAEDYMPACKSGIKEMCFDVDGNCYACHNSWDKIGRVEDGYEFLYDAAKKYWLAKLPKGCLECEHLDMCRYKCPVNATYDGDEFTVCKFRHIMYNTIQKAIREGIL